MKLFAKRTNPQIQTLDQLVERQVRLTVMRAEAQVTFDATLADRQSHLIGGDVEDSNVAETLQAHADAAQSALVGLDDAIAALAIQIANAEETQGAEQRRIKSEADAKELSVVLAKVEKLLPAWIARAREMSDLLGSLNNFHYQVGGIANYLDRVAAETDVGLKVVLDDLSGAVGAIARGEQQIRIGTSEPVVIARVPAAADIFTYTTPTNAPGYRVPELDGEVHRS